MSHRADSYQPGDSRLAWTRITLWRGLLAAALDHHPQPVLAGDRAGASDSPSTDLMAAWLRGSGRSGSPEADPAGRA